MSTIPDSGRNAGDALQRLKAGNARFVAGMARFPASLASGSVLAVWMTVFLCWLTARFSGETALGKAAKQSVALHSMLNPPTMYVS